MPDSVASRDRSRVLRIRRGLRFRKRLGLKRMSKLPPHNVTRTAFAQDRCGFPIRQLQKFVCRDMHGSAALLAGNRDQVRLEAIAVLALLVRFVRCYARSVLALHDLALLEQPRVTHDRLVARTALKG